MWPLEAWQSKLFTLIYLFTYYLFVVIVLFVIILFFTVFPRRVPSLFIKETRYVSTIFDKLKKVNSILKLKESSLADLLLN